MEEVDTVEDDDEEHGITMCIKNRLFSDNDNFLQTKVLEDLRASIFLFHIAISSMSVHVVQRTQIISGIDLLNPIRQRYSLPRM